MNGVFSSPGYLQVATQIAHSSARKASAASMHHVALPILNAAVLTAILTGMSLINQSLQVSQSQHSSAASGTNQSLVQPSLLFCMPTKSQSGSPAMQPFASPLPTGFTAAQPSGQQPNGDPCWSSHHFFPVAAHQLCGLMPRWLSVQSMQPSRMLAHTSMASAWRQIKARLLHR